MRYDEKVYKNLQDVDSLECAAECLKHLRCMLYNYNASTRKCVIHEAFDFSGFTQIPESGWDLHQWESQ